MSKRDRLGNANAAGSGFIAKDREFVFGDAWQANWLPLQIEWSRYLRDVLLLSLASAKDTLYSAAEHSDVVLDLHDS